MVARSAVSAGVGSAVYGDKFAGRFKVNLALEVADKAFEKVGDVAADYGLRDGGVAKVAMHAGVGGVASKAMGGDFTSGAIAAGSAELASPFIDKASSNTATKVAIAGAIGSVATLASGSDAKNIGYSTSISSSSRANNREQHPDGQQVLAFASKGKTEEEKQRLLAASAYLVKASSGIPNGDKDKPYIESLVASGAEYKHEQEILLALGKLLGKDNLFKYTEFDRFDDRLSRNQESLYRFGGGVDLVSGTFGAASLGAIGATSYLSTGAGNPLGVPGAIFAGGLAAGSYLHAESGAQKLLRKFEPDAGSRVLASFERPVGESYLGRKAKVIALDLATSAASAKVAGMAVKAVDGLPKLSFAKRLVKVDDVGKNFDSAANINKTSPESVVSKSVVKSDARNVHLSKYYSVIYRAHLEEKIHYPGLSDKIHFQESNKQFYKMLKQNPEIKNEIDRMYPGLSNYLSPGTKGAFPSKPPIEQGLTIHHNSYESGVMEFMPRYQHNSPGLVQQNLHPNRKGGMKIWGGGRSK